MKLESIFNPKTVAIIGATDRLGSVGRGLVKNLLQNKGKRKIYLINPNRKRVLGVKTLPHIGLVKEDIDLVIIAVPAKIVLRVVKECCQKKVGAIVVISSGFAETGRKGALLQGKVKKLAEGAKIPLIGPNCLGVLRPSVGLNASFAPSTPKAGGIALISQSGALLDSIIDASLDSFYGFSAIISYGNEAGLTLPDFLDWAEKDQQTKVIAIYIEGLKNGRRFFETARQVAEKKPVIILKGGKTPLAKKAVASHTGALAGEKEIYSAAFRQAGLMEVQTVEELLDVAKALSWQPRCQNNIGIITNGGGAGILAADYCQELGIKLAKLSGETQKLLEKSKLMHPAYSKNNPLDIVGDAGAARYKIAIESLLSQKNIYGLLVVQTLQIMTEPIKNAKIIIEAKRKWPQKPIIAVFMGGKLTRPGFNILEKNKIPNYPDPKRAVLAMKALISWSKLAGRSLTSTASDFDR